MKESVVLECNSAQEATKSAPTYINRNGNFLRQLNGKILILLRIGNVTFWSVVFRICQRTQLLNTETLKL